MSVHPNDVWRELGYLETELRRCQAKVGNIRRLLAAMTLPKPVHGAKCPHCGVIRHGDAMADHLANVHGV